MTRVNPKCERENEGRDMLRLSSLETERTIKINPLNYINIK